jgi:hypothetical protein
MPGLDAATRARMLAGTAEEFLGSFAKKQL